MLTMFTSYSNVLPPNTLVLLLSSVALENCITSHADPSSATTGFGISAPGEERQLRVPAGGHEKSTVQGGEGQGGHRGRDVLIKGTKQPLSAIVPKLDQTVPAGGYRLGTTRALVELVATCW